MYWLFRRRSSQISWAGSSKTSQTFSDLLLHLASTCITSALMCYSPLLLAISIVWLQSHQYSGLGETEIIHSSSLRQARILVMWSTLLCPSWGGSSNQYGGFPPSCFVLGHVGRHKWLCQTPWICLLLLLEFLLCFMVFWVLYLYQLVSRVLTELIWSVCYC